MATSMRYRLADFVRFNLREALEYSRDSIAHEYVSNSGVSPNSGPCVCPVNFDLLFDIVQRRKESQLENRFSIHLRLGDVIDLSISPRDYVDLIREQGLDRAYDECLIYYGNHNRVNEDPSQAFIMDLIERLKKIGVRSALAGGSVDEDFVALATSKCLVAGVRGFSWLAASINPHRVIWELQKPPEFPWLVNKHFLPALQEGFLFHQRLRAS
jgi:hypothetical protein